jgi:hypothetical protein
MSIETRISRLVKKMGVKKSRWTVPLIVTSKFLYFAKVYFNYLVFITTQTAK